MTECPHCGSHATEHRDCATMFDCGTIHDGAYLHAPPECLRRGQWRQYADQAAREIGEWHEMFEAYCDYVSETDQ